MPKRKRPSQAANRMTKRGENKMVPKEDALKSAMRKSPDALPLSASGQTLLLKKPAEQNILLENDFFKVIVYDAKARTATLKFSDSKYFDQALARLLNFSSTEGKTTGIEKSIFDEKTNSLFIMATEVSAGEKAAGNPRPHLMPAINSVLRDLQLANEPSETVSPK